MFEHAHFMEEKGGIDSLLEQGYRISGVNESVLGAFVEFERNGQKKLMELESPDARKYISKIIKLSQNQ